MLVERRRGAGSGYPDEEYARAGAEIVATHAEVFARADLIVKVKEPLPEEYPLLRPGQILFTYLHLAASKRADRSACCNPACTAIAYETVEVNRRLPLLEPMSEIAGRMSRASWAAIFSRSTAAAAACCSAACRACCRARWSCSAAAPPA